MPKKSIAFLLGISCLICIVVLFTVFRRASPPPVKKYVGSTANVPAAASETGESPRTQGKNITAVKELLDTLPEISDVDKKETLRFFEILGSEEYQAFLDTYTQELKSTYEQTGLFSFHFQEYFDFFTSQGMPEADFEGSMMDIFQEYFPTGTPEDYETEMAIRFQEVFFATPGSRSEALLDSFLMLSAEPDFSAWLSGSFKGDIGKQVQWLEEQAAIATAIEHADIPTHSSPTPTGMEFAKDESIEHRNIDVETTRPSENKNLQQLLETLAPGTDVPTDFTSERISSIYEKLHLYGTYDGLTSLLDTDPEGAAWLLENFDIDTIERWSSEPMTETQPRPPEVEEHLTPTTKRQEVPPWLEIPE